MVFTFKWKCHTNALCQWVYCFLVLLTEGILIWRAVQKSQRFNELSWKTVHKPISELYTYIAFIVVSILCLPFFCISAIFKIGNYSNDGVQVGKDDLKYLLKNYCTKLASAEEHNDSEPFSQQPRYFNSLWRHIGPQASIFHVIASFCLLLPTFLLETQEIKNGLINKNCVWKSQLDVITKLHNTSSISFTSNDNHHCDCYSYYIPEFLNYIFALIVLNTRYPAVFWYTKMCFSLLFLIHMFLSSIFYITAFLNLSIIYKFHLNNDYWPDVDLSLTPAVILSCYFISLIVIHMSPITIFYYGLSQYNMAYKKHLISNQKILRYSYLPQTLCTGYIPHTLATTLLILFIVSRAPLVYDGVTIYRENKNLALIISIVYDIIYTFIWIVTWFFFTFKQNWTFKVHDDILECSSSAGVHIIQNNEVIIRIDQSLTQSTSAFNHSRDYVNYNMPYPFSRTGSILSSNNYNQVRKNELPANLYSIGNNIVECRQVYPALTMKNKDCENNEFQTEEKTLSHSRSSLNSNDFDYTPENTIVRTYRSSIRDKCGQYFKPNKSYVYPPKAQSSPLMSKRGSEKGTNTHIDHSEYLHCLERPDTPDDLNDGNRLNSESPSSNFHVDTHRGKTNSDSCTNNNRLKNKSLKRLRSGDSIIPSSIDTSTTDIHDNTLCSSV